MSDGYAVILEKKARGRGMGFGGRPWAVRTFKLVKQQFQYFDGNKLKGAVDTKGSKTVIVASADADGKDFPFEMRAADGEIVLLNGSSWQIRDKCVEVLNRSSVNPNWDNPEENERYRLEARLRELEYERLAATQGGAAAAFAGAGADASLKKGRAAADAIKKEHGKNAASAFKKGSAKKRYREAKAAGDKRAMSDAAAEMIQGMIRVKLSRKRIVEQRKIKERWIRDGYARRIQSKYRQRLARRKMLKIKWEKGVIGRKLNSLVRMQGVLKAFVAFKRLNKLRMGYPDLVTVQVKELKDFIKVTGTTPEPLALISGLVLDLPHNHPALNTIKGETPVKLLQTNGHLSSLFHSPTTVYPAANAVEGMAGAPARLDYVIVTIVDNASPSKKELIGQVCVKLSQVRNLWLGKPVQVTLPLGPVKIDVKNPNGDSLVTSSRIPTGTITLVLKRPLGSTNIAGPVLKVSDNVIAMGAWKKRWFQLLNGELQYFNSELALESPKASIACSTVTHIEEETIHGKTSIKIVSKIAKGTPSVTWYLAFDDDTHAAIRRKWLRVLYRNCKQVTPPVEISGKQKRKQAAAAAKGGSTK